MPSFDNKMVKLGTMSQPYNPNRREAKSGSLQGKVSFSYIVRKTGRETGNMEKQDNEKQEDEEES